VQPVTRMWRKLKNATPNSCGIGRLYFTQPAAINLRAYFYENIWQMHGKNDYA